MVHRKNGTHNDKFIVNISNFIPKVPREKGTHNEKFIIKIYKTHFCILVA